MAAFYEDNSKLLTAGAFEFELDAELKRAVRSQNQLTLVTVEADESRLQEVAELIGREVRDTDLIGHTDRGALAVVLLDTDLDTSERVINRLASRIESYAFPTPLRIAVGAASYPRHAVDADSLKREALSRPILTWRSRPPSSADQN